VVFNLRENKRSIQISTGIKDDKYIKVIIADSGVGIIENEHSLIFKPFYYGQPVADRRVKGLGLGLYIADALIKLHSGKIRLESKPESGSVFEVNLPIL